MSPGWTLFVAFLAAPVAPVIVFDILPNIGDPWVLNIAALFLAVNYFIAAVVGLPVYILLNRWDLIGLVPLAAAAFLCMFLFHLAFFAFPAVDWFMLGNVYLIKDGWLTWEGWKRHFVGALYSGVQATVAGAVIWLVTRYGQRL